MRYSEEGPLIGALGECNYERLQLTEEEQIQARDYIRDRNLVPAFGMLLIKSAINKRELTLDSVPPNIAKTPGIVVGPYFLGEDYFPYGLMVYKPKDV